MEKVGIRELKEKLSKYLKHARETGEKIIITDRCKEIAMIVPFERDVEEETLLQLKVQNQLEWSGKKPQGMAKRVHVKGERISQVVLEDRR